MKCKDCDGKGYTITDNKKVTCWMCKDGEVEK